MPRQPPIDRGCFSRCQQRDDTMDNRFKILIIAACRQSQDHLQPESFQALLQKCLKFSPRLPPMQVDSVPARRVPITTSISIPKLEPPKVSSTRFFLFS